VNERPAQYIVAVGSGKGGVGKSTVSLHVALALARRGLAVGLLDADFYGPDIPLMVNLTRHDEARRWDFWRGGADVKHKPIESHGIRIMSVGFLLGERQALTLGAPLLTAALRQLVHQVEWGQLDILLLDLPPGTADLQQQLVGVVALDGAVMVVGPQDVAHLDARKFLAFLRDAEVPVLGAVENMSGLQCPHCGEVIEVFTPVAEARSVWAEGVLSLGRIPLDPALGTPDGFIGAQSEAFDAVAANVFDALQRRAAA
jgi:ATP-binding protein involved in chromosome partitioning